MQQCFIMKSLLFDVTTSQTGQYWFLRDEIKAQNGVLFDRILVLVIENHLDFVFVHQLPLSAIRLTKHSLTNPAIGSSSTVLLPNHHTRITDQTYGTEEVYHHRL